MEGVFKKTLVKRKEVMQQSVIDDWLHNLFLCSFILPLSVPQGLEV